MTTPGSAPAARANLPGLIPLLVVLSDADGRVVDDIPVGRADTGDDGTARVSGAGRRFRAVARWRPLPGIAGWHVDLELRLGDDPATAADADGSTGVEAAVAVAIRCPADRDPRWLVPGVFIGENRPAASRARYPRWVPDGAGAADVFTADHWWLRSDRAALPAVLASGGGSRFALATEETSEIGPSGVGFGTIDTGDGASRKIGLSFPYREEPVVYDGSADPLPADRPVYAFRPGMTVRLAFRAYSVPIRARDGDTDGTDHRAVADADADADADAEILDDVRRWLAPVSRVDPVIGVAETATLAADGLLRWHFRRRDRVLIETADFDRGSQQEPPGTEPGERPGDRLAMHVAWLSGAPAAASLLAHGRRTARQDAIEAGRAVLDAVATNLAPSGTFWGQWTPAGWTKGWTPGCHAVHGRTLAEAALFLGRAASLDGNERWRRAVASNLAFVVDHERDGVVPTDWDATTGEPLSWAGTSGIAWVAALVEASEAAVDRDAAATLVAVARRIGDRHAVDVEAGYLYGAPEDVDLGPTSEDGYVAVQAYAALARAEARVKTEGDGDPTRWIDLARHAADWTLAFRYGYDVAFPPDSPLGRRGFRTLGGDLASPSNQHLHAYGLICSADLLALSRLTGDDRYRAAARAHFAWARQLLIGTDGDLGGRRGMMPERIYQTRYDGSKGSIGQLSHAWCLGLLLDAAELAIAEPELALAEPELADA